jgi:Zn-dependent protease with chaperone function
MSEMTATRMRGLWGAATLAVLAVLWAAAAYFLWASSKVPDSLHLPHLEERRFFSADTIDRAEDFERFSRWNFVLSQLAVLGAFVYYALRGERFTRESAAGRIGTGMLLGMLGFAIVWLVQLPFQIADFWWSRRHDLVEGNLFEFIFSHWALLIAEFLFLCLALLIVMGLAGLIGRNWWILGGPVFVGLAALFLFVAPYLSDLKRLRDSDLAARARMIARTEGVADVPIRVEKVSDDTNAVNAYAFGLGPSRRVVLWDTFLDGRFSDGEVAVVIAHEYGHQARNHLPKGLAWYALFAIPGAFLIERFTRRKGGMRDPAAIPLSLLVLIVLQLAATPVENVISRRMEQEADWMALQTTRDPTSAIRLFKDFTRADLAEPSPPDWAYVLLDTHPTILQRIGMVEAWKRRQSAVIGRRPRHEAGPRAGFGSPRSSSISTRSPASRRAAPS